MLNIEYRILKYYRLKFRKVLNKVKVAIEKGQYSLRDVNSSGIRDYLKDPIKTILDEGENHSRLTNLLVQVRYALEQGQIAIKKETKEKILENINEIVGDEKILKPFIVEIKENQAELAQLKKNIEQKGWGKKLEDIREEIALVNGTKDHVIGDLDNLTNQYHQALEKLKEQREILQDQLKEETGEDVKIQITFTF